MRSCPSTGRGYTDTPILPLAPMKRFLSLFAFSLLLASCNNRTAEVPAPDEPEEQSSSSEAEATQVTTNVTYRGTVEKAGISIYMEGTHRLSLPEGRVLLLQSDSKDLNGYIDQDVFVTGDIRPTVEAGGIIMEVKDIALADGGETSSTEEFSSAPASSIASSRAAAVSSAPRVSSAPAASSKASSVAAEKPSSVPAEQASQTAQVRATAMARSDTSAEKWSQKYCSSHIGFCVPVHKNWWFKSFGTTTNFLWHVEIGPEALQNLGDGPLVVNLVSGSLESVSIQDREIRAQGDYVVSYRAWTDNRHFEITAPASLRNAVQYMTDNLTVHEATP